MSQTTISVSSPSRRTPSDSAKRAVAIRYMVLAACYILIALYTVYWTRAAFEYGFDFDERYSQVHAVQAGQSAYFPYDTNTSLAYTPLVLVFLNLFSGFDQQTSFSLWIATNLLALAAAIVLVYRLLAARQPRQRALELFAPILLLGFMPFWEDIHLGQINILVLLSVLLCLYFSERNQQSLAGAFLALAIIPKTTPLIFVAYFLMLRQYRTLLAAAICLVVLAAVTWAEFGSRVFSDYVAILPIILAQTDAGSYLNLSIVTSALRVLEVFGVKQVAGAVSLIVKLILGAFAAAILWLRLTMPRQSAGNETLINRYLFALLMVVMVIVSPRVWFHHETLLLFPLALLLLTPPDNRYFVAGIGIAFLLQSERLIYNSVALVVGRVSPDSVPTALAFVTAAPTIIGEIALIAVLTLAYVKAVRGQPPVSELILPEPASA